MMKITRLEIVGAIFVTLVALIGFGFASNTGETVIEGNIGDAFDLTVPSTLTLTAPPPGQPASDELGLKVTSNNLWGIRVKSDSLDGKMREYDDNNNYVKSLMYPMHVKYGSTDITLSDADQDLITDETTFGTEMLYNVEINQMTDVMDSSISSGHAYRIVVSFTGGIQI
jgi:hypothetical protein